MSLLRSMRIVRQRVRALLRGDALDTELERELAFHLDRLVAEYVADGMSPAEARYAARRELGNVAVVAEQCRDERRITWLQDMRQDAMYAARTLARTPRVAAVIVASLALGIGANTAVLTVVDGLRRMPLHIPDDDRVVVARTFHENAPDQEAHALLGEYVAWRDQNRSFEAIGAAMGAPADFADGNGTPAERLEGVAVTPGLFSVLQVPPILGRVFDEHDVRHAPSRPLVLSHRLWQRRFGGDPHVIGSSVRMNAVTAHVIGVMPEGFHYPNATVDYWVPLLVDAGTANSAQRFYVVTARLARDVTPQQAQSDLDTIAARVALQDPARAAGWRVRVKPVREAMFGWTRQPLTTLAAAVALALLVACTNVAGLLLARALARRPEMQLRAALGARRGRLVRQLMTEAALLAAAGAALGVLLAWIGVRALMTLAPPPGGVAIVDVGFSARLLGLAALVAAATTFLFGLAPALAASSWNAGDPGRGRLREALVAAQMALTVVLLIGAGLLARSFLLLVTRDVHFDPARTLTFQLNVPLGEFAQRRGDVRGLPYFEIAPAPSLLFERVRERLEAIPGAASVAGISAPLVNSLIVPAVDVTAGTPARVMSSVRTSDDTVAYFMVTPHFFSAIRASLVAGRDFDDRDTASAPWVAIVNQSAARRLWPGQDALGRDLVLSQIPDERPRMVVGIVDDIPLTASQTAARPVVYTPYLQQPGWYPLPGANRLGTMTFMIRSQGDPMTLLPAARQVVAGIAPDRPLANVMTMEQQLLMYVPSRASYVLAIGGFALAAAVLAAIGLYGIVAYTAARRTREIGIRMALGASARDVMVLVAGRATRLVAVGLSLGLLAALAATPLLRAQLWGVTPADAATCAGACLLLLVVSALACGVPAHRATRVDPTASLRCD